MPRKNEFQEMFEDTFTGYIPSPFDKRDYKLSDIAVVMGANIIPSEYETPELPNDKIFNQGNSSMCCACAYSALRYMQEMKIDQSGIDEMFSPTFTYGNRLKGENFEGMYIRSCLKKGQADGSIPLSMLNGFYSTKKCQELVNADKTKYIKAAKPFRISSYYQCNNRRYIQQAIMETGAVITGVWIYDCFFKPEKDTGKVKYNPLLHVKNSGGHAVLLTGWKTIRGRLWWKVLNSWGPKYGVNGYCWIPENYPFIETPYGIVDEITETKWKEYKEQYNLQ